ncbi:MAG: DMT family transporter [Armatimonadota bacterium]|nr:DMT family transporter [Armatimonadota bacterium]
MSGPQYVLVLCLALIAFAANSVLCRLALGSGLIDAGAFTAVRICSGALALLLIVRRRNLAIEVRGWLPALMLFAYAACFSFAYLDLSAGTGALLLFGAVQVTMIGGGLVAGERPSARAWLGWMTACAGMVYLVMPGVEGPPIKGAALMLCAGVAWGIYSLLGKREVDPIAATARNFSLATPMAIGLLMATQRAPADASAVGITLAFISGALTSGLGYVLWYAVLRHITSVSAAISQLTVPVLAAAAGAAFLSESVTARLVISAALTLGGVAIALSFRSRAADLT